eukprot:scaffold33956_cov29-Tisochrysis_lutea.AAC.1
MCCVRARAHCSNKVSAREISESRPVARQASSGDGVRDASLLSSRRSMSTSSKCADSSGSASRT